MKTTGQILQETRQAQAIELEEIARTTKIRVSFLRALESDAYSQLPNGTVTRGFIKNYAQFLGLNPSHLLAVFRRDFVENQLGQVVPRGIVEPVNRDSFWTPKTTVIAAVSLLFTIFGFYLVYQYHLLTGPPSLKLTHPGDNITVAESSVEVEGQTDPEATISVNDHLVALEKGGIFYFRIPLSPGPNTITITATGKSGKTTVITRTVNLTSTTPVP